MLFRKSKEKELKMIWEAKKGRATSYFIGTAHFFPYSFSTSLTRFMKEARYVLFEGPLDKASLDSVIRAGSQEKHTPHLFDELDNKTVSLITEKFIPACRTRNSFLFFNLRASKFDNPVYAMVEDMKPWLAFFTIWRTYLEKMGWKFSVDMEAYQLALEMDKGIVFMETIEEQIKVLENLSHRKIMDFLKNVEQWDSFARDYINCYLKGDLESMKTMGLTFPSRNFCVIEKRDQTFHERMKGYIEKGEALVFVGAPHIKGLVKLLEADGYKVKKHSSF